MRRIAIIAMVLLTAPASAGAQQVADSAFSYANPHPSFPEGQGHQVCVDAAHHNFHTLDGRYYTFGKLVREDGFRTASITEPFSAETLGDCDVVVMANALAAANAEDWTLPSPPALTGDELFALLTWARQGGGFYLIIDHQPFPGVVSDLATLLGAVTLNGGAAYSYFGTLVPETVTTAAEHFGMEPDQLRDALGPAGELGDHPILAGREDVDGAIGTIMTFGGSALLPADAMTPLLVLPGEAFGIISTDAIPRDLFPRFPLTGWVLAGARSYGEGRVVVQAEAAMCSAQLAGPNRRPMGMNNPLSVDNPLFCLNVVRWLAGVL